MRLAASLLLCLPLTLSLTGCGISDSAAPLTAQGSVLQGVIHGGQQPVVGAKVYLLAANPVSGGASISLLSAAKTGNAADSIGSYVLSGANGGFTISNDYTCTVGQQVYLYTLGGNPGSGTANPAAGFLTVLGSCPATGTFPSSTNLYIDEVTTVVSAYALAPFATDATHVSYSGTTLGLTGIANAFAGVANLVSLSTGTAYATTPNSNATVPQTTINTLANILAACTNSAGLNCSFLFSAAKSAGTSGTTPTDTATAAINIAHYPAANASTLYTLQSAVAAPFLPDITTNSGPADFTLQLNYTGGGIAKPYGLAVDGAGNVWVANYGATGVTKILASGAFAPNAPFTGGGLGPAEAIAIDATGNAWLANTASGTLSKFSNTGTALSTSAGYSGGGITFPDALAIDANGYVWVGDGARNACVSEFTAAGVAVPYTGTPRNGTGCSLTSGLAIDASGYVWATNSDGSTIAQIYGSSSTSAGTVYRAAGNGGIMSPDAVAIDSSSHVWVANGVRGSVSASEFSATGTGVTVQALSGPSGTTGAGLAVPSAVAVDGAGNIWFANSSGPSISEFNKSGTALSPAATSTTNGGYIGSNTSLNNPYGIAVDGAGNVWVADEGSSTVIEFYGIASPVVTPIVASLIAPYGTPGQTP
jgi:sugar lactone lactonase YvrE